MRALLLTGPGAREKHIAPFRSLGIELTEDAGAATDAAIVIGGDGTLHRHLSHLVDRQIPLALVPAGSGNDFAQETGFRNTEAAVSAVRALLEGRPRIVGADLGLIVSPGRAPEYFSCFAGVGLDAATARAGNRLPAWWKSRGGYLLGAVAALATAKPFGFGIGGEVAARQGRAWLLSLVNTSRIGGGLRLAPHATVFDGRLQCVIAREMPRLRLLRRAPMLLKGTHLGAPEVEHFPVQQLSLITDPPLELYADGECICRTPVEIRAAAGALKLLLPVR